MKSSYSQNTIAKLDDLLTCVEEPPIGEPFTPIILDKLYVSSKASNHNGFLAAALRSESVVFPVEKAVYLHTLGDVAVLTKSMQKAVTGHVKLENKARVRGWQPRNGQVLVHINKAWRRIREATDLPHLRIHDLRYQFANPLVNSGRSLYEVQQILGHTEPSLTQRYAHRTTKILQEAAETASMGIRDD